MSSPKKIIIVLFLCFLLFFINIKNVANSEKLLDEKNQYDLNQINILKKSWFEEQNGIKIILLNGSFYEMGYQQGYLLKYDIIKNIRGFLTYIDSYDDLLKQWNIQKNYTKEETLNFIKGLADGAEIDNDLMGCMWIWDSYLYDKIGNPWGDATYDHCCTLAAWGNATKSNELLHAHSFDMNFEIIDPITGSNLLDEPILVVCKPDNGYSFMYPSFPGFIAVSGVNEKGISIAMAGSFNNDKTDEGSSYNTRIFEVLYGASNCEEAIKIVKENETFGLNYLICDGKTSEAYIVEKTANETYVGTWNNTIESRYPFWEIENVLRRTNCFISNTTSEMQRPYYNPKDIRYFLTGKNFYYPWHHYKALSKGFGKNWGEFDLQLLMKTLKEVYKGKYDLFWFFARLNPYKAVPWFQWVCCPKTGDFLISYANAEKGAEYNSANNFNLYELLDFNTNQ